MAFFHETRTNNLKYENIKDLKEPRQLWQRAGGIYAPWFQWSESESISHSVMSSSLQPHGLHVACQAPLSLGFFRQEHWSGLPFPSPGDLPNPGVEPRSSTLQADSLLSDSPWMSSWLQNTFQNYGNQNNMISTQKETHRSMAQNRDPRIKPMVN